MHRDLSLACIPYIFEAVTLAYGHFQSHGDLVQIELWWYIQSEWNIMVGHRSLTDQLVFMTDYNFALIRHTYIGHVRHNSYCMDGRESMSDPNV